MIRAIVVCSTLLDGNIFAPSGKTDEPIDFNYKELPQSLASSMGQLSHHAFFMGLLHAWIPE